MLNFHYNFVGGFGRLVCSSVAGLFILLALQSQAATWDVTAYGAIPDCTQFTVTTTANSAVVVTTNLLGSGAVGKVMEIFGGGPMGINTGQGGYPAGTLFPTNNQDLVATITAVNGYNVTISPAPQVSSNLLCTFGTNNAPVFQQVVNMAANGDTIVFPAGNYLIIPPHSLNPNYVMLTIADYQPAFTVQKGGLTFQGAGANNTIFTSCGAWQMKGTQYACRGAAVFLQGPVTSDGPVVFDGITFDGGVAHGRTGYDYWPIVTSDGDGWDCTHHAIVDAGGPPVLQNVTLSNCRFQHWRGEMLIGVVPLTDGLRTVTNCTFYDGEASAFNFCFSHRIDGCRFDTLKMAMEFYEGYITQPCFFQNSVLTNIAGITGGGTGIALGGPNAGEAIPSYTISNNIISASVSGLFLDPVQNLSVVSNTVLNTVTGVIFGIAGYQGSTNTENVLIQGNTFVNVYDGFTFYGAATREEVNNITVVGNVMQYSGDQSEFANGGGWSTNVVFSNNVAIGVSRGLTDPNQTGQWFKDNLSNVFPYFEASDYVGRTNILTYGNGMRQAAQPYVAGCIYKLDDASPWLVPAGAQMSVTNNGTVSAMLYTSDTGSGSAITITNGYSAMFQWVNGTWQLASSTQALQPPTFLQAIGPAPGF